MYVCMYVGDVDPGSVVSFRTAMSIHFVPFQVDKEGDKAYSLRSPRNGAVIWFETRYSKLGEDPDC